MSRRLEGKVILVAGAGGIGNGLATRYAAEGARVAVGDLKHDVAAEVVETIRQAGGEATAITLDGSDEVSVAAAVVLRDHLRRAGWIARQLRQLGRQRPEPGHLGTPSGDL
jgi:NAD(P)-dependent dehydrogenase (short-subunit alcohol dehydrogenase family)